jgi:hypothetical protein
MWANEQSVNDFLTITPNNTVVLFMNHNTSDSLALTRMEALEAQIVSAMSNLHFSSERVLARLQQFQFASIAVSSHPFLSQLLTQWASPLNQVLFTASEPSLLNGNRDCRVLFLFRLLTVWVRALIKLCGG